VKPSWGASLRDALAKGIPRLRSPTGGLPVSPSFSPTLAREHITPPPIVGDRRLFRLCALAIALGLVVGAVAIGLGRLIDLFTNIAFFGRFSIAEAHPAENHLGLWLLPIPILGGVVVGLMARFGLRRFVATGSPKQWSACGSTRAASPCA